MRQHLTLLLVVLLLALSGCAPETKTGTFLGYEIRGTGRYPKQIDIGAPDDIVIPPKEIREKTGNATVRVEGMRVTAKCPVQGLRGGQVVTVQQNTDGAWIVTGLP